MLDKDLSPLYGFANKATAAGELGSISSAYDRSLEQTPLDQYELEAGIARKQPEVEKGRHTWLSDSYTNFMNKKNEIELMTERAKLVNEIDPELNNITEQLNFISEDDPLKDTLETKQKALLEQKQEVLNEINSLETAVNNRKKDGVSAHYQAEEMLAQDKDLMDLDYWAYSVPGTMGSSFSDLSSYAAGVAGWAVRAAATALAGSAIVASGGTLLPVIIAGAGTALSAGINIWGVNQSNRSESLAETYGAYKDRVNAELSKSGTDLNTLAEKVRGTLTPEQSANLTTEQIADKIITGEIKTDNQMLSDAMAASKKNLDYVYNRNRALVVNDYVQNALTLGAPFGMGTLGKLISKPIKGIAKATKLGSKAMAKGGKLIDDVIGWNTKMALKNPVKHGLTRIPWNLAKYGVSAASEGLEEGSQNIFNREYVSGQYDEESSNFLSSYADYANANYRTAKVMMGIDNTSELAKDPDFWNEVKGGVALGLFMGGLPTTASTVVGTAKAIGANRTVRDLTADNLDKKSLMQRVGLYSQKASKGFITNYDDEIISLLEGYKHTGLPEGVTEEDVDAEIKLAKSVQASTKNKHVNELAKAAGFTPGTREYNAFLGLRHLAQVDQQEAADNMLETQKSFTALRNEYLNNILFDLFPEEEREAVKQKVFSEAMIAATEDWINNMESKPADGKRKFGIMNPTNPMYKDVLRNAKQSLIAQQLALKTIEGQVTSNTMVAPEPSQELINAYIGTILSKSDLDHSSANAKALNSEIAYRSAKKEEDKAKIASEVKSKVEQYLKDVDETEEIAERNAKDDVEETQEVEEADVLTPVKPEPEQKIPDSVGVDVIPAKPAKTPAMEQGEEKAVEPEFQAEEGTAPEVSEEETHTPTVEEEEYAGPIVGEEEEPFIPVREVFEEEAVEPTVETEETPEPSVESLPAAEPTLNSENVGGAIADSETLFDDQKKLPKPTDDSAAKGDKDDAAKVNAEIERKFDETDGSNPRNPSEALALRGLEKHDKVSNTLYYSPKSTVPMLPGYEPGSELAKLLEIPGVLQKAHLRFFINEAYTEPGSPKYVKGDRSTWHGASILIEISYGGKKYLMNILTPNGALRINNDTEAIQNLNANRNAIIEALENAAEDEEVVPTMITTTNGLYNQNIKIEDGQTVVIHRPISEIKGFGIPEDPFEINEHTVDIAIGKGLRGEPAFGLFDANEQLRAGRGGSGQIFYMCKPSQTLSGKELPVQLNLSRFNKSLVDFIYNAVINYIPNSDAEAKDVRGKDTFVEINEMLENMVRFGDETFVTDEGEAYDFLREKQFGITPEGLLFVGTKAYNVKNITPAEEQEIKEHIASLHWRANKETFWKPLSEVFPSVKNHFNRTSDSEVEVIPGIKFTREQIERGMTMMGWMISNNLLSCDLKDNLFTDAFNHFQGVSVQKADGSQKKLTDAMATGLNNTPSTTTTVRDPVTDPVEKPAEALDETATTEEETPQDVLDLLKQLKSGKVSGDVLDIYGQDAAGAFTAGMPRVLLDPTYEAEHPVTAEEIQWFKNVLGLNGEDVKLEDKAIALGNDVYAMGLCKLYSTLLFKGAEQGTLYHEAFHKVSMLLQSPEERKRIYQFYRNLHKSEATDDQIEEALAEEFREFMLNKVNHKMNIVKKMFKLIKNFINRWFNKSEYGITKLFNQISTGHYRDKSMNEASVNEWLEKFKENGGMPFRFKGVELKSITNVQAEEVVKTLSSFALILNNVRYGGEVNKINLDTVKSRLHPKISEYYVKAKQITPEQAAVRTEIYNNFDKVFKPLILNEFVRFKVKQVKEEVDAEIDEKVDGNETGDEMAKYTKQSFEISSKAGALPAIKMLIACLPAQEFVNGNPNKLVTKKNTLTGLSLTVDFDKAWNRFSNAFANCNTFKEILIKADKLGQQEPLFKTFANTLRTLTADTETDTEETRIAKENLKTQVRNTFRKHIASYTFCLIKDIETEDGEISTEIKLNDENSNRVIKTVLNDWTSNLLNNSGIVTIANDEYLVNKKQIQTIRDYWDKLKDGGLKNEITSQNIVAVKKSVVSMLGMVGVYIDMQTLNLFLNEHYERNSDIESLKALLLDDSDNGLNRLIDGRIKDLSSLSKSGEYTSNKHAIAVDKIYNNSGFLTRLVIQHNITHPSVDETSIRTTDDKIFYAVTEKNYFFDFVDELNNDEETLNNTCNVTYNGGNNENDVVKGSSILDNLKRGLKLKSEVISGFKREGSNDQGRAYSEISPLEDYVLKMALTRGGRLVLPTMGDSVSYNVLSGSAIDVFKGAINIVDGIAFNKTVLDRFADYFETEIDTILFNYDNPPKRPQDTIKNYDTGARWGYKFRYFGQLIAGTDFNQDLADAEELDKKNGDKNYTTAKQVINKIAKDWEGKTIRERRKIINDFLMRVYLEELKYAEKLGLIKFDGKDVYTVENVAIPNSFYNKAKSHYGNSKTISPDVLAVNEIMMNYIANHIASEIEFTKLFNKDPAYYKSPEDLLKRRREVFSTGTTPNEEYDNDPEMSDLTHFTVGTFNDNVIVSRQIKKIMESASRSYAFDKLQREEGLSYDDALKALNEKDPAYSRVFDEAKALAQARFAGYEEVNQTDATVLLSPEGYKQLVRRIIGWQPDVAAAFEILNNATVLTEENAELYHKSLNTVIAPLKCMFFGGLYNAELRREVPIFDKMALFPVFPIFATGDMKHVLERMQDKTNPIHMIAFESAVKVGQDKNANMYDETGHVDPESINNIVTHKQPLKYFRRQLVTDPHDAEHEQMFVSQAMKAALLNIRKGNKYTTPENEEVTGKELLSELFACMNELTDRGSQEIEKEFGVHENEDGVMVASQAAVANSLRRSAESSKMNQNVVDGLEVVKGKPKAPISGISDNPWMEAALISSRNRKVIDVNTPGGMFIQMSAVAYNDLTVRSDGGVRDLHFDTENGTIESVVSINLLKTIIPDYDKKSFVESRQWLIKAGIIGRGTKAAAIGYRIPAQGPSSVAALSVVDVYPENIGDTITLPDEWTTLTGSDFDIDKLFVARYAYDESGNRVTYDKNDLANTSTAGLQNRMLDLFIASISNPLQYSESRQPLDAVTTYLSKTILGDIDNLKGKGKQKHDQIHYATPSFHNEAKSNLMAGKTNLGAFALSNSHHALAQAVELAFKSNNEVVKKFGLRSFSKIHSDQPNYHDKNPKKGKPIEIFTLISDWLSAMVNAHVDVAKDAYINRLNVRKLTINTVNLLLRGGKGESTFYFMAQEVLVKFADEYEKYRGFYGVELGGETPENKAYQTVVKEYIDKYNKLKSKDEPALDETYSVEPLTEKELAELWDVAKLRESLPAKETAAWYYHQLRILQAYQELQPAAKALSKAVTLSQVDTKKFGNNFALQQNFLLKLLKFYKEDRMFTDAISVIRDTFLKEKLIKGLITPRQNFGNILLRTNPLFEQFRNIIYTMLGSPEYLSQRTVNNVTRMMEASFKMSFFTKYAVDNAIDIKGLLNGSNSVPKRLVLFKQAIKAGYYPELLNSDGTFSNTLLDNINAIAQATKEDLILPGFISFKPNKDEDHNLDDHIIRAWEDLLDSDHKEVRDFARDLAIYSMVTSADAFGKNNIFKYVPNSFRESSGYFDFIRGLEDNPAKMLEYMDVDMIFRNLWWDDGVVPTVKYKTEGYGTTGEPETKIRKNYGLSRDPKNYILVNRNGKIKPEPLPIIIEVPEARKVFEMNDVQVFTPYIKMEFGGKNNPISTRLYKYTGVILKDGKIIPIYSVTEKRGMNFKGKTLVDFSKDAPLTAYDELRAGVKDMIPMQPGFTRVSNIIPTLDSEYDNYIEELLDMLNGVKKEKKTKYEGVSISTKGYKKGLPQKNPDVDFVFTENAQAYQTAWGKGDTNYEYPATPEVKLNVSDAKGTNQAGIRTDEDGNLSENAYGVIVKKFQQDANGKFVKKEGQFNDTEEDFEMFKQLNTEVLDDLESSSNTAKVFPSQFAMGKAALPKRFADWLQFELLIRFGLHYTVAQNTTAGYEGYGLVPSEEFAALNPEIDVDEVTEEPTTTYTHSFTFADGTIVPTAFELNDQQKEALLKLEEFYDSDATSFTLKGYAGTGKTTIMKIFDTWLHTRKVNPMYVSPTHRANAVTKMNNPKVKAITLHSLLGLKPNDDIMEVEVDLSKIKFSEEVEKQFDNTTFIIDECSMINDSIYKCLVEACKTYGHNNKLIFLGDPAQLQPVSSKDKSKVFTDSENETELTKVERTGDNAILDEATTLRNDKDMSFKTSINEKGEGVQFVSSMENALSHLTAMVTDPRFNDNPLFFKLLTATNRAVSQFNQAIRQLRFGRPANELPLVMEGELLMAYTNEGYRYGDPNNPYDIINSVDYKVVSTPKPEVRELPGSNGIKARGMSFTIQNVFDRSSTINAFVIDPNDSALANAIMDRIDQLQLAIKTNSGNKQKLAQLYQMRSDFNNSFYTMKELSRNGKIKKNKTFDYGYAHTIHKSQGGTYDNVMVLGNDIEQGFEKDPVLRQQLKYVAVTRAKYKVIYVQSGNEAIVEENTYKAKPSMSDELSELDKLGEQRINKCK